MYRHSSFLQAASITHASYLSRTRRKRIDRISFGRIPYVVGETRLGTVRREFTSKGVTTTETVTHSSLRRTEIASIIVSFHEVWSGKKLVSFVDVDGVVVAAPRASRAERFALRIFDFWFLARVSRHWSYLPYPYLTFFKLCSEAQQTGSIAEKNDN